MPYFPTLRPLPVFQVTLQSLNRAILGRAPKSKFEPRLWRARAERGTFRHISVNSQFLGHIFRQMVELERESVSDLRPDSDDTCHLLERAGRGEPSAVDSLLARHRESLRVFVDLHLDRGVRSRVDPSDVVQEAQADVARRLPEFLARRPVPFHLWARQLAYQRVLNARRDHRAIRRDVGREVVAPAHSSVTLARSLISPGPTPSEAAQAGELAERAAAAIETLPDADKEVLLLRHTEGLPFDEIAILLDIEPTAARKRFGRALRRLERSLAEHGITGDDR